MKFKKDDCFLHDDSGNGLQEQDIGTIEYTGILVASLSALIIVLISVLTANIDFIASYTS
jgi:hypothetical protein